MDLKKILEMSNRPEREEYDTKGKIVPFSNETVLGYPIGRREVADYLNERIKGRPINSEGTAKDLIEYITQFQNSN